MLSLPLHDNEWLSLATSGGFFLTSVLLCLRRRTVTRHRKSTQSDSSVRNDVVCNEYGDTNDINDANDRKFNLECYRMRRMEDRMSFREIDRCEQSHLPYPQQTKPLIPSGPPYDTYSTAGTADTDVFDTRRRRSSEIVVQSNWNHFEGYNPDDDVQQTTGIIIADQQRKNVQHVNEIHPMIKSSNIFRDVSIESDSGEEILSKLLEGEDLPDQELYCGYQSPKQNSKQHKFTSPSITPPPFRASSSSTDDELTHHPVTAIDTSTITKPEPRLPNPSMYPLNHIRRARSVPDPPVDTNGIVDSQAATNDYIASNRMARAKYNASIMPNKLILIRHGQSLGNVDEKLYATTPDNAMPLTELGWEQAKAAGKQLKQLLTPSTSSSVVDSAHFIVSPYVRTVETFHGIVSAWCDPSEFDHIENYEQRLNAWYSRLMEYGLTWAEDPRIREQDFGNYQEPKMIQQAKRDRHMFGAFYYRFPLGESASDVFDRVSTFLDSLWRSFDTNNSRNYVLVTHGISIRVILARYFRYTIDQFHQLANPRNCEMVVLQHDGAGRLVLGGRYELETKKSDEDNCSNGHFQISNAVAYTFHPRLRVLPQKYAHKAKVRMKYGD